MSWSGFRWRSWRPPPPIPRWTPSWAPTRGRTRALPRALPRALGHAPIRPRKEYADSWLKGSMAETSGIRVVLSDDHALVRQGFRRIFEDEPGITVVGEGGNGAQAVELARTHKPDVV